MKARTKQVTLPRPTGLPRKIRTPGIDQPASQSHQRTMARDRLEPPATPLSQRNVLPNTAIAVPTAQLNPQSVHAAALSS